MEREGPAPNEFTYQVMRSGKRGQSANRGESGRGGRGRVSGGEGKTEIERRRVEEEGAGGKRRAQR
eukprot:756758-Hanusia_phi.AAC.13